MSDPVDEFLRRHHLPASARAELLALARPAPTASATMALDSDDDAPVTIVGGRYEDLGVIGAGGSSVVHRVRDPSLDRTLAMKLASEGLSAGATARFLREARLTASLDHPGVVPVHELGFTDDGRPYFTMREVHGTTLTAKIRAVHAASDAERWGTTDDEWTLFRLLDALRRVCETIAWAHHRGIVHRDLKPDNVMVGDTGEILVLDWGIARTTADAGGGVSGTPAYMAPEQARGEPATPRSDVFALGATLLEVLVGVPPRTGTTVEAVLGSARSVALALEHRPRPLPDELVRLAHAAVAPEPAARPEAAELAQRIRRWQEGAERRERAAALVEAARALAAETEEKSLGIARLRDEIARRERDLHPWDPAEVKRPLWALQDDLDRRSVAQDLDEVRTTELLRDALTQDPQSRAARTALAARYQRDHAAAEQAGDRPAARRAELLLRAHDDGQWAAWLSGEAALHLETDPPGAEVLAFRVEERDRRRVPVRWKSLGTTPLACRLPPGSWVFELSHPERAPVRLPARLERAGRWPAAGAAPVAMPALDDLGADDVLVPAGPYLAGGDPRIPGSEQLRVVDVPSFVVRRFPVTNAEYLTFLDDLVATGRGAEAAERVPRLVGDPSPPVRRVGDRHVLAPDAQGDVWAPDWPVFAVSGLDAAAYAAWESGRTGRPWRLGTPDEWEKAARGVDGRRFPWGDHPEPTWSANRMSRPGRPLPRSVREFPEDEGPYGVRGMAGGASTCTRGPDGRWWAQGGAWSYGAEAGRAAMRTEITAERRTAQVGLRLFRDA